MNFLFSGGAPKSSSVSSSFDGSVSVPPLLAETVVAIPASLLPDATEDEDEEEELVVAVVLVVLLPPLLLVYEDTVVELGVMGRCLAPGDSGGSCFIVEYG